MRKDKVIWSEGMFLLPQHFQQQDRYLEQTIEGRARALAPFAWGFASLALDDAKLLHGKVAIATARGVLPDGTPFDIGGIDPAPEPLDIPLDARDVTVLLALPVDRPQARTVDLIDGDPTELTRYVVADFRVGDDTAPEQESLIQVARKRLKLILASAATDAYACIGVVQVKQRNPDNNAIVLDRTYIPPCVSVRDNAILAGFASEIHGLLHQRGEALARRIGEPGPAGSPRWRVSSGCRP